jgi:hypothetical protein
MCNEQSSLFQRLNAPFPYQDYKYDQFGNRCYVSGQTISERLNEVLGVGYWKYQGVGSEQIKSGMNEGDATKSAITDGMKKCSSRIGVASDLYKSLITWDNQRQMLIVPRHYKEYYEKMGGLPKLEKQEATQSEMDKSKRGKSKNKLTEKLKTKTTTIRDQIQNVWLQLAGNLDGFTEWYEKKRLEQVTDQQILHILQSRLNQKVIGA